MNMTTYISSLKTFLTNLSWTSSSGGGTTKFNGVFDYPNYSHTDGYPFVVISDSNATSESLENTSIMLNPIITIQVCVNSAIINKSSDDEQKEEATLRIREATDVLKAELNKLSTISTLGNDWQVDFGYGAIEFNEDLNLLIREFSITLIERVSRL